MINPSALNVLIVGAMMIIFACFWRMLASWLVERNPESGLAQGMAVVM